MREESVVNFEMHGFWVVLDYEEIHHTDDAAVRRLADMLESIRGIRKVITSDVSPSYCYGLGDAKTVGALRKALEGCPDDMRVEVQAYDEFVGEPELKVPMTMVGVQLCELDADDDGPKKLVVSGSRLKGVDYR